MTAQTPYNTICALSKRAHILDGISTLLGWDQETYMPEKAAPVRAIQKELLAELSHTIKTSPEFESALSSLINLSNGEILAQDINDEQKAALKC